jgi:general secretion pathway protein A
MYTAFFGLREKPFALSPDPRFLYLSEAHREALAHLLYGIEQGEGFIAVTGEVGTGKTTLCRTLLRRLGGEVEVAFLFNPKLSAQDLLESILVELGVPFERGPRGASVRELVEALNHFLLERRAAGKRVLLIVDEAQGLRPETLEQIRLLSNLETESEKLIQILLLGQPELDAMLESPDLRQLRQRIGVRWRLAPLSRTETASYVRHRLRISAGIERDHVFADAALAEVFRFSGGIPRLVNLVCDRALLATYAAGAPLVGAAVVRGAARELRGDRGPARPRRARWIGAAAAATALAAGVGAVLALGGPRSLAERLRVVASPLVSPTVFHVLATPDGGVSVIPAVDAAPVPPAAASVSAATPAAGSDVSAAGPTAPAPASDAVAADPATPAPPPAVAAAAPGPAAAPAPAASAPAAGAPQQIDDLAAALALRSPGACAAEAYAAVLDAWSLPRNPAAPAVLSFPQVVSQLAAHGLDVFSFSAADLEVLRALDHPVLLGIDAADGVRRIVALRELGDGEAELDGVVAGAPVRVPIDELRRIWFGDAHLVWRDFEPLPDVLRPGDAGKGVVWLQQALAEAGYSPGTPSGVFDANTEEAVRAFQTDRHLTADGAVGPLTKMGLYRALPRYAVPHVAGAVHVGQAG